MNLNQTQNISVSVLATPEVNLYYENYNKDLEFENEKVHQMDNIQQRDSNEEDDMITSALGLLGGMEMKGAIPFKDFETIFSDMKFMNGSTT